jgi:hypothetical protein
MVNKLLITMLLTLSLNTYAKVSGYLGARTNFGGLGAARIGIDTWEFGQFAPGTYGANKRIPFSNEYFAVFGAGITSPSELALLTGFGFNFFNFWNFGLRGELYTVSATNSVLSGAGTLGLSWNY